MVEPGGLDKCMADQAQMQELWPKAGQSGLDLVVERNTLDLDIAGERRPAAAETRTVGKVVRGLHARESEREVFRQMPGLDEMDDVNGGISLPL